MINARTLDFPCMKKPHTLFSKIGAIAIAIAIAIACNFSFAVADEPVVKPVESVKPGINESFLNPELNVSEWVDVKLSPSSVDAVFICDTYHHFEFPQSTLKSIFEALKPGGRMIVVDFERIAGESREWTLSHVRAGEETFAAEIEAAGFKNQREIEVPGLKENYCLEFRKP
jgi:predicted methyltransferase